MCVWLMEESCAVVQNEDSSHTRFVSLVVSGLIDVNFVIVKYLSFILKTEVQA